MQPFSLADAEADLRAAIDTGEIDKIDAASVLVDRLDVAPTPVSLHSAALYYASVGLKVFPLSPGTKIPFKGSNGCNGASSNPDIITGWWEDSPDANIGIATGHLIDVVDVDGHEGQKSRARHWDDIFETIDNDSIAKVLTPRPGGMHLWVPATGDGNSQGIVHAVDYRGAGGYVVAPPSVIAPGGKDHPGTYRFLGAPQLGVN